VSGGANNGVLGVNLWEGGYFYVVERYRTSGLRETDGHIVVFGLDRSWIWVEGHPEKCPQDSIESTL
jgi:hypothetical protein